MISKHQLASEWIVDTGADRWWRSGGDMKLPLKCKEAPTSKFSDYIQKLSWRAGQNKTANTYVIEIPL
jgi:hypothetical protein